ncbi:MAG: bifunctional phosphopantothenoylcysteine decarboxylase/phosphopantothenate--cysteine ligase CoaBC [Muribaculaceae bacterium]|nr:bifunctional phosphopantothenoylcysteine decarboxylase/phosphopantothenate--cysteine ligase CoaBC [Muribaculaceae bacterium]
MLKGKHIILGITGSIAAYKAAYLTRLLIKKGAEVQIVITPSGKEFITPVTLSALTGKPVVSEFFTANTGEWHSHVDLGLWADAMVIAPATASTIAKMATGVADNMLITTYLSAKAPVFVAPAMDLDMYKHPSTQANLKTLQSFGNQIIEPASGFLASGLEGKGRMEEPENIVAYLENYFAKGQKYAGKKVMVTAGPTYEKIDPVRFIGNHSTGKMGFAIAEEFASQGAEVTLISGPVNLSCSTKIKRINVTTAVEMCQAAQEEFVDSDIAVMCAAVADYAPKQYSQTKIKRSGEMTIELVPNPDIAATLGAVKRDTQILAGFALETNDEEINAQAKLEKKNLDYIVLNSLADKNACFGYDTNKITIISREGEKKIFPLKDKKEVAKDIVEHTYKLIK